LSWSPAISMRPCLGSTYSGHLFGLLSTRQSACQLLAPVQHRSARICLVEFLPDRLRNSAVSTGRMRSRSHQLGLGGCLRWHWVSAYGGAGNRTPIVATHPAGLLRIPAPGRWANAADRCLLALGTRSRLHLLHSRVSNRVSRAPLATFCAGAELNTPPEPRIEPFGGGRRGCACTSSRGRSARAWHTSSLRNARRFAPRMRRNIAPLRALGAPDPPRRVSRGNAAARTPSVCALYCSEVGTSIS
jgi:hypothetical protein